MEAVQSAGEAGLSAEFVKYFTLTLAFPTPYNPAIQPFRPSKPSKLQEGPVFQLQRVKACARFGAGESQAFGVISIPRTE